MKRDLFESLLSEAIEGKVDPQENSDIINTLEKLEEAKRLVATLEGELSKRKDKLSASLCVEIRGLNPKLETKITGNGCVVKYDRKSLLIRPDFSKSDSGTAASWVITAGPDAADRELLSRIKAADEDLRMPLSAYQDVAKRVVSLFAAYFRRIANSGHEPYQRKPETTPEESQVPDEAIDSALRQANTKDQPATPQPDTKLNNIENGKEKVGKVKYA